MDNIYDDLENYNDGEVIEELRNENQDLHSKIKEYQLEIDRLQRKLDIAQSDFNTFSINYSSLLKTARAEVERKAQIIASLNIEKDKLVLSSIKNTNNGLMILRRNMARGRPINSKDKDIYSKPWNESQANKTNKDAQEVKKPEPERMRNDENRTPSPDTVSTVSNEKNTDNKLSKLDHNEKKSDSKDKNKKPLSLKLRRKSMPVLNKSLDKISSDEEEDACTEEVKGGRHPREEKSKKYFDRHKISETSGIDEKYSSYHESSRETYYKSKAHRDLDNFTSHRDKYRHRKHYSPEQIRRITKESEKNDIFKHNRVLVSPGGHEPVRMPRDRRSNHEKDRSYEERRSRRDDYHDEKSRQKHYYEDRPMQRDESHIDRHKQREYCHKEERTREKRTRRCDSHEEVHRSNSRSDDRPRADSLDDIHRQRGDVVVKKLKSRDNSERNTRKYGSREEIHRSGSRSDDRRRRKDGVEGKIKSRNNSEKSMRKYDSNEDIPRSDSRSDDSRRSGSLDARNRRKSDLMDEKVKSTGNYEKSISKSEPDKGPKSDESVNTIDKAEKHTRKSDPHEEVQRNETCSDDRLESISLDAKQRTKCDVIVEKTKRRDETDTQLPKHDSHEEIKTTDYHSNNDRHRSISPDSRNRLKSDIDQKGKSIDSSEKHKGDNEKQQRNDPSSDEKYTENTLERGTKKDDAVDEIVETSGDKSVDAKQKQKDEPSKEPKIDDLRKDIPIKIQEEKNNRRRIRPTRVVATDDNDEPSSKRARIESCWKPVELGIVCLKQSPAESSASKLIPQFDEHSENTCQSPDDQYLSTQPTNIIPTASICEQPKDVTSSATGLADPRLSSSKYIKGVEGDKVVISTVTGRNVDLIAINTSKWDPPLVEVSVAVPVPLQKPPEYTDEMVQELYMDIDNPVSNTSLESGEINTESSDVRMADYLSKNFYQDYENERINQLEAKNEKLKHKRDLKIGQDVNSEEPSAKKVEHNETTLQRKIARPSKPELLTESTPNPLGILLRQLQSVCNVDATAKTSETKLDVDATFGTGDYPKDKNSERKIEKACEVQNLRGRKLSAQELVEGDLALSDETCDNLFTQKQKRKGKSKDQMVDDSKTEGQKATGNKSPNPAEIPGEKKTKKQKADKKPKNQPKIKDKQVITDGSPEGPTDDKSVKKSRKKSVSKKPSRTKDSSKTVNIEMISSEKNTATTEKKAKHKKTKSPNDSKHQNKGKFTELFGDSCSLITPEDLGLTSLGQTNKHLPIFEDAQDSVDVNIMKKAEMAQQSVTSSQKEKSVIMEETRKSIICKINIPIPTAEEATIPETVRKPMPEMEVSHVEVTEVLEVVQTVISAVGQHTTQQTETENKNESNKIEDTVETTEAIVHDVHIPAALATSTPHKKLLIQLDAAIECRSYNSSEVNTPSVTQSTVSNDISSEVQNNDENDKPDVRIFVKRRRRLKK